MRIEYNFKEYRGSHDYCFLQSCTSCTPVGATYGRVLNAWFNDCVVGKSGQGMNPIIVNVDPVPYNSICACLCL